ncbi:MAG: hypothetical protein A2Y95_07310 [Deltaproteobacteria bacterium RBG_13_65_10]|nr:MAG: hypothetical protein A2Y95_07310 [Deltaproteobacteria bacterium RBG_13_65_10]
MSCAGALEPTVEREAAQVRCPFFRPVLVRNNEVVSGYCTVPDLTRFGLDFSPPPLDACLRKEHKQCPFYCDQRNTRSAVDRRTRPPDKHGNG